MGQMGQIEATLLTELCVLSLLNQLHFFVVEKQELYGRTPFSCFNLLPVS